MSDFKPETIPDSVDSDLWNGVVQTDVIGLTERQLAEVVAFAESLPTMTVLDLRHACESAIYGSAFWASRRGSHPEHAMCTLAYNESERRGPTNDGSIYAVAHRNVMREQGY